MWVDINMGGMIRKLDENAMKKAGHIRTDWIQGDEEVYKTILETTKNFNEDDVYIDIGACIGETSIWINKGSCIAIEPNEWAFNELKKTIEKNSVKIIPFNLAMYNKKVGYRIVKSWHEGLTKIEQSNDITMTETLDAAFPGIRNVKLIKIDTEGCELEVLEGGADLIRKNRPVLIVEFNKNENKIRDFMMKLEYDVEKEQINLIGRPHEKN